jgi:hypothetical protein
MAKNVLSHGYSKQEFEDILYSAEQNVKGEWEAEFVEDLIGKFTSYGTGMFLSEKQRAKLEGIANDQRDFN